MAIPHDYRFATLKDHIGHDFDKSSPTRLDQPRIDDFAECTGDDQWIHVDVERARTQTAVGNTIAHGLLLLALAPAAQYELGVYPADASNVLNYGFDTVRFLAPVTAGTSIVLRVELIDVVDKGPGRTLMRCRNTAYTPDAPERPVMVAESLSLVRA